MGDAVGDKYFKRLPQIRLNFLMVIFKVNVVLLTRPDALNI